MTTNFTQGWLTLSEVAEFLRVSPTTVRRLITTGRLRANNTSCATRPLWRIHEQWIEACLEYLRDGDTLHVHSIDRFARNLQDLLALISDLTSRAVTVQFHKEGLIFTGEDSPFQPFSCRSSAA